MKGIIQTLRAVVGAAALAAVPAHATLLFSPAELPVTPFPLLFTFDAPTGSGLGAPVNLGQGVTFSTSGGPGSLGPAPLGTWLLEPDTGGGNGTWGGDKTFAGVDGGVSGADIASMTFTFDQVVQGVGGFMNFDPTFTFGDPLSLPLPLYIAALGVDGSVLEDYELPLFTPGGFNEGVFYGIGRDTADIAAFVISGPYAVVDDLRVAAVDLQVTQVPEPSTYALLLAGLGLLAWQARRARQR